MVDYHLDQIEQGVRQLHSIHRTRSHAEAAVAMRMCANMSCDVLTVAFRDLSRIRDDVKAAREFADRAAYVVRY